MSEKKLLMQLRQVKKYFPIRRNLRLRALNDINFNLYEGERFGVVGESGCGKSTLGRVMLQLYPPSSGDCVYYGHSLTELCPKYLKKEINRLLTIQNRAKKYALECSRLKDHPEAFAGTEKLNRDWLREGSKTVGSLILCRALPQIQKLFAEAHHATFEAHKLIGAAIKFEAKAEKLGKEGQPVPPEFLETARANRDKAASFEGQAKELRDKAFSFRGKDIDPGVSPHALNEDFRKELDSNYETGINLSKLTGSEMKSLRSEMLMVFQDPSASLDPRQAVGKAVEEVLKLHTTLDPRERKEKVMSILQRVGLRRDHYYYYPNALSGGQKQRVCIARAIATDTRFVVLDESLAALDVSVQAQILSLLDELSLDGRAYLFITHDLGVAKYFCNRILVMYLGCECEMAQAEDLFASPLHPYTQSLLAAVPRPEPREVNYDEPVLEGEVPNPLYPPEGCFFHTRCGKVMDICKKEAPKLVEWKKDHPVACHLYKAAEQNEIRGVQ